MTGVCGVVVNILVKTAAVVAKSIAKVSKIIVFVVCGVVFHVKGSA